MISIVRSLGAVICEGLFDSIKRKFVSTALGSKERQTAHNIINTYKPKDHQRNIDNLDIGLKKLLLLDYIIYYDEKKPNEQTIQSLSSGKIPIELKTS